MLAAEQQGGSDEEDNSPPSKKTRDDSEINLNQDEMDLNQALGAVAPVDDDYYGELFDCADDTHTFNFVSR
jgi:hypothetical protein